MNQPDPPAAMRERRFEADAPKLKELCIQAHRDAGSGNEGPFMPVKALGYKSSKILAQRAYALGWQAALPSSEKIEEIARRIEGKTPKHLGNGYFTRKNWSAEVAAILREALRGGK